LDALLKSFRRLRQRRWWRDRVDGGIGTVEVTFNKQTRQWHPHLHVMLDGVYLPQAELKEQWEGVTKDSFIVHITAVHGREQAAGYISKYISKPSDVAQLDLPQAVELAKALAGRRTVITFGAAHGTGLPARKKGTDHAGSSHVVSVQAIRIALADDQPYAKWAIHRLHATGSPVATLLDSQGVFVKNGPPVVELVKESSLIDLLKDCDHWTRTKELPMRYRPPPRPHVPEPLLFD
jgi:hypothetical protein